MLGGLEAGKLEGKTAIRLGGLEAGKRKGWNTKRIILNSKISKFFLPKKLQLILGPMF